MIKLQAVRGMNDILPTDTPIWQFVEATLKDAAEKYGYQEIRFPLVEQTTLFNRAVGEVTDIVEKEMYVFEDRSGDSLALRPEGTACVVRAGIEHGFLYNQIQKLWYRGPFFRHDRPQKGRYRQFHQFGIEVFGLSGPDVDAEMILLTARIWKMLGIIDHVALQINTLGTPECRKAYRHLLTEYFKTHADQLDEDSLRRLESNPLRILDSKNKEMQSLIENAPKLWDCLDDDSKKHFKKLCDILDAAGILYEINSKLVRGLDYYTKTVFEWVTDQLGAQDTICGGGRFDGLVEQLGGYPTPAIGCALGIERLIALLEAVNQLPIVASPPDIYMVLMGEDAENKGILLAERLRSEIPSLKILMHCGGGNFKNQFKKADKSGAIIALVIGENELTKQEVVIKFLREEKPQEIIADDDLIYFLKEIIISQQKNIVIPLLDRGIQD